MRDPNRVVHVYGLFDRRDPEKRVRYVGATVHSVEKRRTQHTGGYKRNPHSLVYRWISEIGDENLPVVELETSDWAHRHEREIYWTVELETLHDDHDDGLNKNLGKLLAKDLADALKDVNRRRWADPEARQRWLNSYRKTAQTVEGVARRSAATTARFADPAERERMSETIRNRVAGDDVYRAKLGEASRIGTHVRWHVNRGVIKTGCEFCSKS